MSKIFVASDTHFGHENIIRYANRPFRNAEDMNRVMIGRWNDCIASDDEVYFLGDFAMGPGVDEIFIYERFLELNGNIKVILGNHDKESKYSPGFVAIAQDFGLEIEFLPDIFELEHEGMNFVMCHYPMNDWNNKFKGSIHLHGHKHTQHTPTRAKRMIAEKRYDVGVDMYGGPVQLTGDLRFLNDPQGWL